MYGEKLTADAVTGRGNTVAYLPVAAFVPHGPHLPMTTDLIISAAFARAISSCAGAFLLPVQPFAGGSEYADRFSPGVDPALLFDMIMDLAQELRRQGFRRLVVQERGAGKSILFSLTRHLNAGGVLDTVLVNPTAPAVLAGILECDSDLHAGEADTSLMLHIAPELVRRQRIAGADCVPAVSPGFLDCKSLFALSQTGVWGMPSLADARKGQRLFEAGVRESVREIREVFAFMDKNGDYTGGR
jgi:creatinine amidohydrolase